MSTQKFLKEVNLIVKNVLDDNKVDRSLKDALNGFQYPIGRLYLLAIGKAAYQMAKISEKVLGNAIYKGLAITKYGHGGENLKYTKVLEAGHPIPDEKSFEATKQAIDMCEDLDFNDKILFLVSGGGSALFELPLIDGKRLEEITDILLKNGAEIREINTIRKHLSAVKGGRFAKLCMPADIELVVLSDVIGDDLSLIASGSAYPDSTTISDALTVAKKYGIDFTDEEIDNINEETPKELSNVKSTIIGSVRKLCESAIIACEKLGYRPFFLTDRLSGEAREVGALLANVAQAYKDSKENIAFVCGGETIVHVKGNGKGGRNQELALAAAIGIKGISNVALFSLGSDGNDGPTDAAGGYVDGKTYKKILEKGKKPETFLENNDAYNALDLAGGLIKTGPTGTNVNDISVLLIKSISK